ncbi:unnamed protein product [Moneuplotes crassus]|uniref:EF-hand domain-containing protein n=1 Tax=Euplotes crassus TaxID=5936 RepID=A0AAD1UD25_EUPCR|nr:unnamed protein product [Moneuplotes crassus]
MLNSQESITWLQKRFQRSAKVEYLHTREQLESHYEIERCFNKFDEDKSGTLDFAEIEEMFKSVGIYINRKDLHSIFSSFLPYKKEQLDFKEFKSFILSEDGNKAFRKIIQKYHKQDRHLKKIKDGAIKAEQFFVPYDFKSLLEFVDLKIRRESAIEKIFKDDAENTDFNFRTLFELNQMNQKGQTNIRNKFLKTILNKTSDTEDGKSSMKPSMMNNKASRRYNAFNSIPSKVLLRKEKQKLEQLIQNAKERGRQLAKQEWNTICQARAASHSQGKKTKGKDKISRKKLLKNYCTNKSRSIDSIKTSQLRRKKIRKGNEIKIFDNISVKKTPELTSCLAQMTSDINFNSENKTLGSSVNDKSIERYFTSKPSYLSSDMSHPTTKLTSSNSQTLVTQQPSCLHTKPGCCFTLLFSHHGNSSRLQSKPRQARRKTLNKKHKCHVTTTQKPDMDPLSRLIRSRAMAARQASAGQTRQSQ